MHTVCWYSSLVREALYDLFNNIFIWHEYFNIIGLNDPCDNFYNRMSNFRRLVLDKGFKHRDNIVFEQFLHWNFWVFHLTKRHHFEQFQYRLDDYHLVQLLFTGLLFLSG